MYHVAIMMFWYFIILFTYVLCCRYEDGVSVLRKVSSAADFIWSDAPLDVLGSVTTISFEDPDSLPLKDHNLTTEEVLHCLFSILRFQQYFLISLIDLYFIYNMAG